MRGEIPLPRPSAMFGPCYTCGETGHLNRFFPKLAPRTTRWYPADSESRGQSERNIKRSANDVVPNMVKEVVNCIVCESRDEESVDGIIESIVVQSVGSQFSSTENSCAGRHIHSQCELIACR